MARVSPEPVSGVFTTERTFGHRGTEETERTSHVTGLFGDGTDESTCQEPKNVRQHRKLERGVKHFPTEPPEGTAPLTVSTIMCIKPPALW